MRLFVLLENACHDLDLTAHMQGTEDFEPSYQRYSATLNQLTQLKDEQLAQKTTLERLEQLLTHGLATGLFTLSHPLFSQGVSAVQATKSRLQHLVSTD